MATGRTRLLRDVRYWHSAMVRACYAVSGTDIGAGARRRGRRGSRSEPICLRACYAVSGTDISLRACYAVSGTEIAYGGTAGEGGERERGADAAREARSTAG
eukprot:2529848-Rhodomonas_salina.1